MLLDREQQPAPAQRAAANLQVPRVELPARSHDRAGVKELRLKLRQRFLRRFPLVPPVRHLHAPEPRSGLRASSPPRGQATPHPPGKASHRLHEMQKQDDEPQTDERPRSVSFHRDELGMAGADRGLRDWNRDGHEQRRSDDDRGTPTEAQEEHPREKGDRQVPLRGESQGPARIAGSVEGLERRGAPDALVHATAHRREIERDAFAVEASAPAQLPDRTVSGRPLVFQQGLGLPVADLLLPELSDRFPAVMPDDGGRRVPDESPAVAEPPAHIDVVAGGSEYPVETADRFECLLPERHVASRDVLRDRVGQQDRIRTAGRVRDGIRDPTVVRRREIRSPHADVLPFHEREREESQPVNLRVRVVIDERDDLPGGDLGAEVARGAQPLILGRDEPDMIL